MLAMPDTNSDMADFQLTRRMLKDFASLDLPKGRRRTGLFVAEGAKCLGELLAAFECRYLFATSEWLDSNNGITDRSGDAEIITATPAMLNEITRLTATPKVIAFFALPEAVDADVQYAADNLVVALDRIQDPGNLGTILRTCDWMGVRKVVASTDTVDAFSPKVVQAAMGATARVSVAYTDLPGYLASLPAGVPVYGTFLNGDNIYSATLSSSGVLIMGNEGRGISPEVEAYVGRRLLIPSWPPGVPAVESLNVGMACAIALSQFRSRLFASK